MPTRSTRKLRLGEALLSQGKLTQSELESALAGARAANKRLGEYLIARGIITDNELVDVICAQMAMARYRPADYPVDESLRELLPMQTAQQNETVPLCIKDGTLFLAHLDAPVFDTLFALEDLTGMPIEPVLCTQAEFNAVFRELYGEHTAFDSMMSKLQQSQGTEDLELVRREEQITNSENDASAPPVIRMVNLILTEGVRSDASDVHINPEHTTIQVRYRIQGLLRKASDVPKNMGPAIVSRLKIMASLDISVTRTPQDGRFTVMVDNREINVRLSTLPTTNGENVVLRLLDMSSNRLYSFPELGMSAHDCEILSREVRKPYGMILATGPTGSGKSSSLYSIIRSIQRDDINIITLEDPVEYRMPGVRQVQLNTRAGMTFASGLRSILRQDPDVILVGEIRDEETAKIAVQAALTGHLVFSTLHSNDALGAVYRLLDMGIEPHLVTSILLCSFAQRLVRTICPHCKRPYTPNPAFLERFGLKPEDAEYMHGAGCSRCNNTGYAGRTGIFELFTLTPQVQHVINSGQSAPAVIEVARQFGFTSMQEDVATKIRAGITTVEEALRVTLA